jgi:hypothetical protein
MFSFFLKGWPFISIFWAIYDLVLLTGSHDYAHHWGYWQDYIKLFNEHNPSGTATEHELNDVIYKLMIIVGIVVSLKRLAVCLFLGRQTFGKCRASCC